MPNTLNSILDNVIYLDIETTGLDENTSEIIEIGAVKIKNNELSTYTTLIRPRGRVPAEIYKLCSGLNEAELYSARTLNTIISELIEFLEDLPLICHNGSFERRFFKTHIKEVENEIMDSMELCAILEPDRREYNLESIIGDVTIMEKNEAHRGLDDSIDTLKVVNSLLCRLFDREEKSPKKKSLYEQVTKNYEHLKEWCWTKYLLRPAFFNFGDYEYVNYEDKVKNNIILKDINIDYKKYEDLFENEEIWNNGGDFGYQYRKDQKEFAKKIRETIEREERIFIEAPTGSGKTFAYVTIAALEAYMNKQKNKKDYSSYIISTNTKELQNQLIEKDIPTILKKLKLDDKLKYGAIKGKSNYVCVERLNKCEELEFDKQGNLALLFLRRLAEDGNAGDIENINYVIYKHFKLDTYINKINCDNDNCNLEKCKKTCYLRKRYNELPEENLTVINHSLLACWPYGEKKKINHIILDEGHNLMEKCYDFFSEEFNSEEFLELLETIEKGHNNILYLLLNLNASFGHRETIDRDKMRYIVNDIIVNTQIVMNDLRCMRLCDTEYNFTTEFFLPREDLKYITKPLGQELSDLKYSIYPLFKLLSGYVENIVGDEDVSSDNDYKSITEFISKIKNAFDILDKFLEKSKFYAKVLEVESEYKYFKCTNVPLNVGELVNEHMLKDVKSTTFLSATLRIDNGFMQMKKHLGQEKANEFVIPSTFKLKNQTKIFALNDVGRYDDAKYVRNISKFIFETAKKINGHILVLFNNNARLEKVNEELEMLTRGSKIEIHMNKKSINALKDKDRTVVILGSKGFFEGIDVPGDGLNCVMLDKLPNYSPDYPILRAIREYQNKQYRDVNYPQVCIKVKQIYGRLIRSIYDYGYFIILDPGQNDFTIRNLERDLGGPRIECISSVNLLNEMEFDYKNWKRKNLNSIIMNMRKEKRNIQQEFNDESKKHKLFWELEKIQDNKYYFKNINFNINGRL